MSSQLVKHEHKVAIESYRRAISFDPNYLEAHFNLGVVYMAAKNKGAALAQHQMLKTLDRKLADEFFKVMHQDKILSVSSK